MIHAEDKGIYLLYDCVTEKVLQIPYGGTKHWVHINDYEGNSQDYLLSVHDRDCLAKLKNDDLGKLIVSVLIMELSNEIDWDAVIFVPAVYDYEIKDMRTFFVNVIEMKNLI